MTSIDIKAARALLARVETCSSSDQELDALIVTSIMAPTNAFVRQSPINGAWCIYTGEKDRSGRDRIWAGGRPWDNEDTRNVTSSLDAAVALVEQVFPGGGWTVARAYNCPDAEGKPFFADVASREFIEDMEAWGPSRGVIAQAGGTTAALALCTAFLRAIVETEAGEQA